MRSKSNAIKKLKAKMLWEHWGNADISNNARKLCNSVHGVGRGGGTTHTLDYKKVILFSYSDYLNMM